MSDHRLAILLPTFRFDATARHAIETAAAMASDEVSVYIGDNSCNAEKQAYLHRLALRSPHCHVYCHATDIGAYGNWNFLWRQSEHEFLCYVADDDIYTPDYFYAGLEVLRNNAECAAASGFLMVMTWRSGNLNIEAAQSNLHPGPVERVAAYSRHTGFNTMVSAVHRREAVAGYLAYMHERPFSPPYLDQFMTYTALAHGTSVAQPQRQVYIYNNTNWTDQQTIARSNEKYWLRCGFPPEFHHLHLLCWAVDVVHYFNSIYRPRSLDDGDARTIVETLYETIFRGWFLAHVAANDAALTALFTPIPDALLALRALVDTPCSDHGRILKLFVRVLRGFDAELARRYETFVARSLRSPVM